MPLAPSFTSLASLPRFIFVSALLLSGSPFVEAFDAGPHHDITGDVLEAEGFAPEAAMPVQWSVVQSFFSGLQQESKLDPLGLKLRGRQVEETSRNWDVLAQAVRARLRACAASSDVEGALVALGASLYHVQDFYEGCRFSGPGKYGSHPTWFDVGSGDRAGFRWTEIPGSRSSTDAYISACVASRQWIRAARVWTSNEAFWRKMMSPATNGRELRRELDGAWRRASALGLWSGKQAGLASKPKVQPWPTIDRLKQTWTMTVEALSKEPESTEHVRVPSSSAFAGTMDVLELTVDRVDPLGAVARKPHWYARAHLAGRDFRSGFMPGPSVRSPIRFLRMVARQRNEVVPLSTLRVTLRMGDDEAAGTDARLFLRINDSTRYDFYSSGLSKGQTKSFVFVPDNVNLDQVAYIQLDKVGGSDLQLAGIRVEVNGEEVYKNDSVNSWLKNANQSWRLPSWRSPSRYTIETPVRLELWDADPENAAKDEQADINPLRGRSFLYLLYNPGTRAIRLDATGQERASAKGEGDAFPAEIGFTIRRYVVKPPSGSA